MAQTLGASAKRHARSRSQPRANAGWAPLRADAPGRLPRRRGAFPDLDSAEARDEAVRVLRGEYYAASSIPGVKTRINFLYRALGKWGQDPFPPTLENITRVGAALKKGNYRSGEHYLSQYRVTAEQRGFDWSGVFERAQKDAARACGRGLGPGMKSLGLPLDRLRELPSSHRPWVRGDLFPPALLWWSAPGSSAARWSSQLRGLAS